VVKHIVVWRLKDSACGNDQATNARLIREKLEALRGRIPGLLRIEVGIDFSGTENSSDVVLATEFATRKDLAAYQTHPEHKAVGLFVREVVSERRFVDYETD
jgi:heme-degrading monooxygenase HmoA